MNELETRQTSAPEIRQASAPEVPQAGAETDPEDPAASTAAWSRKVDDLATYYEEAGPDYAAWSPHFNMHFGFFRPGINPFARERMLEQMNAEVLTRLRLVPERPVQVLDMGCGVGATLRSFARRLPQAELFGVTLVPWQVRRAAELNAAAPGRERIHLVNGDYEQAPFCDGSFDAVYALESSCYAHGADKHALLAEAHRLLRPGGRLVVADGFLRTAGALWAPQRAAYRRLCKAWVIETLGELDRFEAELRRIGFGEIVVEPIQFRVAPSVFHIPWVTGKFLLTDVVFGSRQMTAARWNNLIAPALLPWVSWPLGPMLYSLVSATRQ